LEDKGFNENKPTIARELLVPGVTLEKGRGNERRLYFIFALWLLP
jgi:hypothetical protein